MVHMFKTKISDLYSAYTEIKEADKQINLLQAELSSQPETDVETMPDAQEQALIKRLQFKDKVVAAYRDTGIQQSTVIYGAITTMAPQLDDVKRVLSSRTSTVASRFKDNEGLELLPLLEKMGTLLTSESASIQEMLECIAMQGKVAEGTEIPSDLTCAKISAKLLDLDVLQSCLDKNVAQLSLANLERKVTSLFTQCAAFRYMEEDDQLTEKTDGVASTVFEAIARHELLEQYVALCTQFCSKVNLD